MSDDFQYKREFAATLGISVRTVDQWVAKGKVERIVDLDRRALFRLAPAAAAPTARQEPPEWAQEMMEEIRALRAEVAALRAVPPVTALPAGDHPTPAAAQPSRNGVARHAWWRRIILGEKVL